MNLLIMGDAHLKFKTPQGRCDDFFDVQFEKFVEVYSIAEKHDCKYILQPGDLFDSPDPSNILMARYLELMLSHSNIKILTVSGQHDLIMRSYKAKTRSAMYLFECANALQQLSLDPLISDNVAFYGLSWGQESPSGGVGSQGTLNILLAHVSVGNLPIAEGHELLSPIFYLRQHPLVDLAVVGDYHYTFKEYIENRLIINAGCLVRKTRHPFDIAHKPCVFVYNTDTMQISDPIYLTITPPEDVFLEDTKMETNKNIEELLNKLKRDSEILVNFGTTLKEFIKKAPRRVKEYIENTFVEVKSKED